MVKKLLQGEHGNYMIPFFWQHGEAAEVLKEELAAIRRSGIRAVCVESRPHPDFAGEGWWRDMDVIMDDCREHGIDVWVLDDARFPTGFANGRAKESPHRKLFLKEKHVDILGPQPGASLMINLLDRNSLDDRVVAVVAARRIPGKNMDHSTHINLAGDPVECLIDLTPLIDGDVVYWDIPEGLWRVFIMAESRHSENARLDEYINYLTPEGTDILIDAVYRPHYERYAADFGKTFKGFFSDEPQFGSGHGYHAVAGRYPYLTLPWCDGLPALLDKTLGEDSRKYWPGIWYSVGEDTARIRYAYMDAVTRLYGDNFATRVGDWCRAHNSEYMGHVIEENNAHARLGSGTGHFFRALWGQDISGIDVVLHEVIPGIKGGSHAWTSKDFEADDDFFHYMLAQMAVSLAYIDPKKKGRTMCEIFGAYGWQEGLRQMKWLADFFLARGINHYVPHAFTPKDFPDPDCPPHFYARGENPQFRYFKLLMDYMNRVSALISDGRPLAQAAVLYHGEAEWAGGRYMKTQEPVRVLNQAQTEAAVVPIDILTSAEAVDGQLAVSGNRYAALVVPYAEALPAHALRRMAELSRQGVKVIFVDAFPSRSCTEPFDIRELTDAGCTALALDKLPDALSPSDVCRTESFEPDLKVYPYEKDGARYFLLFNESLARTLDLNVKFKDGRKPYFYDAMDNAASECDGRAENGWTSVAVRLTPYGAVTVAFEDRRPQLKEVKQPVAVKNAAALDGKWTAALATAKEYPRFTPTDAVKGPGNLNRPGVLPRFSGIIRYETVFTAETAEAAVLDMGEVGETAEVWLNDERVGVRMVPPYRFDLSEFIKKGENRLRIDVTNTLVYQQHDRLSAYQAIQPSGLVGPVALYTK